MGSLQEVHSFSHTGLWYLHHFVRLSVHSTTLVYRPRTTIARQYGGSPKYHWQLALLIHTTGPAWSALHWQEQEFVFGDKKKAQPRYAGRPGPEVDRAWHDLLNSKCGSNVSVDEPKQ